MIDFYELLNTESLRSNNISRQEKEWFRNAKICKFKCDLLGSFQTL